MLIKRITESETSSKGTTINNKHIQKKTSNEQTKLSAKIDHTIESSSWTINKACSQYWTFFSNSVS